MISRAFGRTGFLLLFSGLFLQSLCSQVYSVFQEGYTPEGWTRERALDSTESLTVHIALTQRNLDKADGFVMEVSDPDSPRYGDFWTVEQVHDMFAPSEEATSTVRDWLVSEGVHLASIVQSEDRGWMSFKTSAAKAGAIFRSQYFHFTHSDGRSSVASDSYFVPDSVRKHIDYVDPGAVPFARPGPSQMQSMRTEPSAKEKIPSCESTNLTCCDELIHPGCIRALYDIPMPDVGMAPHPNNSLAIFELNHIDSPRDLNMFFRRFAPYIPKGTYPRLSFFGKPHVNLDNKPFGEVALDLDCAYPIVYPQKIQTLQSYGFPDQIFSKKVKPPPVISSSWANSEERWSNMAESVRICNGYMKLALLGTSVLESSGDGGTGCKIGKHKFAFTALVPANCPYLTSVGATEIAKGSSVSQPERAVKSVFRITYKGETRKFLFTSGGGFSRYFRRPSYQDGAVKTYFQRHDPGIPYYNGTDDFEAHSIYKYNRLGRGYPDVSANGLNIAIALENKFTLGAGTSAAAPIWAAIINRIVEERLKAGKGPLGLLNPAFYKNPGLFNDITEDHNSGCGYREAFKAVPGWDPVTGLGTPNYPKLLEYFMSLK